VVLTVSLERVISQASARARCEGCGEEILNERQVRFGDSTLCRACAGEAYYRVVLGGPASGDLSFRRPQALIVSPTDGSGSSLLEEGTLAAPAPAGAV